MSTAALQYLAMALCPRDIILKQKVDRLGTVQDTRDRIRLARVDDEFEQYDRAKAREKLFEGNSLRSKAVLGMLERKSLVPTRSAFSRRLSEHGFNYYELFAPDLMHEFELGVWKAVFMHLLRIAYAHGGDTIFEINQRYRQIPSFGQDTIRRFSNNVSGLKKLAARDYEDLLQCALPVFDGLLPKKHDRIVQKLLFELATWHGLAKLRLHTETTINDLQNSTTRLGAVLRDFKTKVCPNYDTKELPSEEAVRLRRAANKKKKPTVAQKKEDMHKAEAARKTKSNRVYFNMCTYKLHGLGGYPRSIRERGTTDGTSTQIGELEHRRVKRFYNRIRKGQHVKGIAHHVRRERLIHIQNKRNGKEEKRPRSKRLIEENLPPTAPGAHHQISLETRNKIAIDDFLEENGDDPAIENFYIRLKNHLLSQLLASDDTGSTDQYSPMERSTVYIVNDNLYQHHTMRINYTTYDIRRDQDTVNPRTHPDIQILASRSHPDHDNTPQHPYLYARVLGIFHAKVVHLGPLSISRYPQHLEFLFVRWFQLDTTYDAGWQVKRLHRIHFVPQDQEPFGFVDPSHVVRSIHLTPAFLRGRTSELLGPSLMARCLSTCINKEDGDTDWRYYHVAMFCDRDYIMRYRGGGVGHKAVRNATNFFLTDRDSLDIERRPSFRDEANTTDTAESESMDTDCGDIMIDDEPAELIAGDDDFAEHSEADDELDDEQDDGEEQEDEEEANSEEDDNDGGMADSAEEEDEEEDEGEDEDNELALLGYAEL